MRNIQERAGFLPSAALEAAKANCQRVCAGGTLGACVDRGHLCMRCENIGRACVGLDPLEYAVATRRNGMYQPRAGRAALREGEGK